MSSMKVVRIFVSLYMSQILFFFFQAEDGIRDVAVTGVQTCALPIYATPTGLLLHMAGGPNTVNLPSDPGYYSIVIGPITKNVWYDFVYHVKWSSGAEDRKSVV